MTDDAAREQIPEVAEGADAPAVPPAPSDEVAAAVLERFPGSVFAESHGQSVVYVDKSVWAGVARFLRDEQGFTMCVDVTGVDHLLDGVRHCPAGVAPERFEVVASFLAHARNRRIRVICEVPATDTSVESLTALYPGVAFPEREVLDLLGIDFEGHPEPTRILMPDDWEGHPLRKDYAPARVPVTFKGDPTPR